MYVHVLTETLLLMLGDLIWISIFTSHNRSYPDSSRCWHTLDQPTLVYQGVCFLTSLIMYTACLHILISLLTSFNMWRQGSRTLFWCLPVTVMPTMKNVKAKCAQGIMAGHWSNGDCGGTGTAGASSTHKELGGLYSILASKQLSRLENQPLFLGS